MAGLPGLTAVDAEVTEGPGVSLGFEVTLDRASDGRVTVDYATADGSATAGQDYTAARGTLTFASGETRKTVTVAVLDDSVDEGSETLALRLSNASGAHVADGEATGTITNSDPLPQAWLVRFGRAAADHAVDAVTARFDETGGGSHATLGGRLLWTGADGATADVADPFDEALARARGLVRRPTAGFGADITDAASVVGPHNTGDAVLGGRDLLLGSSFRLSSDAETGRRFTAWGRAAATRFDGMTDGVSLDGEVATFLIGADAEWNRWLAGVALAHSLGAGGFRAGAGAVGEGDVDSTLTAVHPYVQFRASDRLSAWGMLGYGSGELTLATGGGEWSADLTMKMAAGGARGVFARGAGGLELAARMDALLTWTESDAVRGEAGNLDGVTDGASRLRLLLEGSRTFTLDEQRVLAPTLQVGMRRDGGDAETGVGLDVGGTLRYADASLGLNVEASGHYLVAHEDAAYREWGASASMRLDPGVAGKGLSLSLAPSWGAAATGGTAVGVALNEARGLAGGYAADTGLRLDADVAYGLAAFRERGAMQPFAGMRLTGPGSDWRAGIRWAYGPTLTFGFQATRRESAVVPTEHGIVFEVMLRH